MSNSNRCIDCYAKCSGRMCARCKSERLRIRGVHDFSHDPRYAVFKAARVAAYARRADQGLPLFEPPLTPEELR